MRTMELLYLFYSENDPAQSQALSAAEKPYSSCIHKAPSAGWIIMDASGPCAIFRSSSRFSLGALLIALKFETLFLS